MKRYFQFMILIVLGSVFHSCEPKIPSNIQEIILKAGDNGEELIATIHYYQNPKDSLKLRALYYLMLQMESKFSYYGEQINKFNSFFDFPTNDHNTEWGRYVEIYGQPNLSQLNRVNDMEVITSEFLINNIDLAFKAWMNPNLDLRRPPN